jgi:hypothetical protein
MAVWTDDISGLFAVWAQSPLVLVSRQTREAHWDIRCWLDVAGF